MKKDTICAVPWMHLNFEPNGKVVPCCLTSTFDYFAGDLTTQSIEEVWNSENMKRLRREMMEGKEPEICVKCFSREKVTGESGRIYHNKEFSDVLDEIPDITLEDGTCTKMELKYWDFRFSNLCNFKCRSCGPRYSSSWAADAKKMNWSMEFEKVTNIDTVNNMSNFDFLKEQVKHVRKIYFAGGEPLLMDEHWQILDLLVENERFDVKLSYNTNCSMLTYGKKNALDYWSQWDFGQVEVWPSIDEIGERAEIVRSGTVWSKVENNLKELTTLDNIIIRPGLTIGAMNVFRLPEIISHLTDIGVINKRSNYQNFFINLLEWPQHYHVHILSDDHRKDITNKIKLFVDDYNKKYHTRVDEKFTHILYELSKPFDKESAGKFMRITYQLDEIRGEDLFRVIPELDYIRENYEASL
jgi:radical SAM protein with 4Fe4S-binding SPASM domain